MYKIGLHLITKNETKESIPLAREVRAYPVGLEFLIWT